MFFSHIVVVVQSLSHIWLFVIPWTACSTPGFPAFYCLPEISQTHVHWVSDAIQSSHPLSPLLLLPSVFPSIRVFYNEWALRIWWPQYWSFSFSISPSNEYWGLISFRIDWFGLQHNLKASILGCSAFCMVQLSHLYMTTGKAIALTIQTFFGQVMAVLFNTSRFVIDFLPRSKRLKFCGCCHHSQWFWRPRKYNLPVSTFSPSICHEVMGLDAMILMCWMLSFNPSFSLSFIKKLFSSSLLSAIRVVSSACLRLLIFFMAILLPACDSCSLAFCIMYSGYQLNKQGDYTAFDILLSQFWTSPLFRVQLCCFLTCIQVSQEAGKVALCRVN